MLVWGSDYFDPNSNAQAFCENPDDSDSSKLKILAWRSHFQNAELTAMSQAAAKELDSKKRIAMYEEMQRKFRDAHAAAAHHSLNWYSAAESYGAHVLGADTNTDA